MEDFFKKNGERVIYTKNQHLVWKHDDSVWVFFLVEGLVRASFSFADSTKRIIGYFQPGMTFAKMGSFFSEQEGTLSYTAETTSLVLRVKRSEFLRELDINPKLSCEYLDMTLRNQIFLVDRIVYQGERNLYARGLRWLVFMSKYYCKEVDGRCEIMMPLTQETIADFLHATRESVNALLAELKRKKYIKITKKKITLLNQTALLKELQDLR